MRTTIPILRVKNGMDHHGYVVVRRFEDEIDARVEESILELFDCGDRVEPTAFILEVDGELYEAGRVVTLSNEEYEEADRELSKLESSLSKEIKKSVDFLRPDNAFYYSNEGRCGDLA